MYGKCHPIYTVLVRATVRDGMAQRPELRRKWFDYKNIDVWYVKENIFNFTFSIESSLPFCLPFTFVSLPSIPVASGLHDGKYKKILTWKFSPHHIRNFLHCHSIRENFGINREKNILAVNDIEWWNYLMYQLIYDLSLLLLLLLGTLFNSGE